MIQTLNPGSPRLEGARNDTVIDFHLNIQWRILIDSSRRLEDGKSGNDKAQENGTHEALHSSGSLGIRTAAASSAIGSSRPVTAVVQRRHLSLYFVFIGSIL